MKDYIEQFKKKNGNESFTQKEMIMYLVAKIDKIDEGLSRGSGKIASNRTNIRFLKKIVFWLAGAYGAGFTYIISLLIK